MTADEYRRLKPIWAAKAARLKALNSEADDLACAICEMLGGDAERWTEARRDVFRAVWRMPQYNSAARDRALTDPI